MITFGTDRSEMFQCPQGPVFLDELNASIRKYTRLRRTNGALAKVLILLSIAFSFVLTVVTASFPFEVVPYTGGNLKWIVLLSPIPGLLGLVYTGVEPNRRSIWFSAKATRLTNIWRLLEVGAITEREAATQWNTVDTEMEKLWEELSMRMVPQVNPSLREPPPKAVEGQERAGGQV